jgi:hypothetical protein
MRNRGSPSHRTPQPARHLSRPSNHESRSRLAAYWPTPTSPSQPSRPSSASATPQTSRPSSSNRPDRPRPHSAANSSRRSADHDIVFAEGARRVLDRGRRHSCGRSNPEPHLRSRDEHLGRSARLPATRQYQGRRRPHQRSAAGPGFRHRHVGRARAARRIARPADRARSATFSLGGRAQVFPRKRVSAAMATLVLRRRLA